MSRKQLRAALSNPVAGFLPWIAFSVVEGPGRFEMAVGAALGIALLELFLGIVALTSVKILDLAAIAFFVVLGVVGYHADASTHRWLENWAGELSGAVLVAVSLLSIIVRKPFTIQYAKAMTAKEYWHTPVFMHINYMITWVWTIAFAITTAVGWYGDGPLNQPDNIWTNWIIQIGVDVLAIQFTNWYPDHARRKALKAAGKDPDAPMPAVS